jgi:glycosyltransferase involved in cell wall biosynthesis
MKILQLDFDDLKNPIGGGQARVTYEINRSLAKRHEITVVTSRYPGSKDEVIDGIRYVRTGSETFPLNFAAFILGAPEVVRKYPHDILIESFTPPVSTAFTPLFTKAPVVGMVHWLFASEMSAKYKIPFFAWEKIGLKYYHNFIVFSEDYKNKLLESNPKANILVNPTPVDGPPKKPIFEEEDYILFLGRADIHQKGIDLLIRSFDRIAADISTKLLIAGGGKDVSKIQKLIARTNNREKIEYIGKFDQDKRNELLASCKFLCLPSRYEIAPLVAKEAMSYGKPLVVFDVLGVRETVNKKCALYVAPFDINQYGEAIKVLLTNDGLRMNMSKEARRRFETLPSWDDAAKNEEKFLFSLLR